MEAHTPGPWLADQRLTGGSISITQRTNPNMQVARVKGRAGEQEANAALIAAAPDMADELERQKNSLAVLRLSLGKSVHPDVIELIDEMRDGAKAALKKAGRE